MSKDHPSFYEYQSSIALRLGDVIDGCALTRTIIRDNKKNNRPGTVDIHIEKPINCVILTPCCSIRKGLIAVTPLVKIKDSFFDNAGLKEDFTCANRPMRRIDALHPIKDIKKLSKGKIEELESPDYPKSYEFLNFFFYAPDPAIKGYVVDSYVSGSHSTGFYMIDFLNIHHVHFGNLDSPREPSVNHKVLELSVDVRNQFRDKFLNYFLRVPDEDQVAVSSG